MAFRYEIEISIRTTMEFSLITYQLEYLKLKDNQQYVSNSKSYKMMIEYRAIGSGIMKEQQ